MKSDLRRTKTLEGELNTYGSNVVQDGNTRNIELGQWYWLKSSRPDEHNDVGAPSGYDWLACVVHIGSNFVKLESPRYHGSSLVCHTSELLFSELHEEAVFEPNPERIFSANVRENQGCVKKTLSEINAICQRLGVSPKQLNLTVQSSSSTDLAILNQTRDVTAYKGGLIEAKDKELPELFRKVKVYNNNIARWLGAETTALKAQLSIYENTISTIEDRVFNVSLYAGIEENAIRIQTGEPAEPYTKINLMQRRLYMDEECLLDYDAGGMDFKKIEEFDTWLLRPENLNRLLPHEKCILAMRVRRDEKDYRTDGTIDDTYINFHHAVNDKITYLYIRNGENVSRVNTEIEFGEMLFPDDIAALSEPVMVRLFVNRVEEIITVREYEDRILEKTRIKADYEQWKRDNPENEWRAKPENNDKQWEYENPFSHQLRFNHFHANEWYPSDDSTSKHDLIQNHIADEVKKYNRIVLILQGLLDRSELLHPHPPIQLSRQEDFDKYISLHYDANRVLTFGDAPDFEEYRNRCNLQITKDSVFVGQQAVWIQKEAERENARRDNSRYRDHIGHCNYYLPEGNKGPGVLARADTIHPRSKKARFRWLREGLSESNYGYLLPATITVPFDLLLNVSAYKKGDYKRFFEDPRSRKKYLKWAPYLLAAEDYACGKKREQLPTDQ